MWMACGCMCVFVRVNHQYFIESIRVITTSMSCCHRCTIYYCIPYTISIWSVSDAVISVIKSNSYNICFWTPSEYHKDPISNERKTLSNRGFCRPMYLISIFFCSPLSKRKRKKTMELKLGFVFVSAYQRPKRMSFGRQFGCEFRFIKKTFSMFDSPWKCRHRHHWSFICCSQWFEWMIFFSSCLSTMSQYITQITLAVYDIEHLFVEIKQLVP